MPGIRQKALLLVALVSLVFSGEIAHAQRLSFAEQFRLCSSLQRVGSDLVGPSFEPSHPAWVALTRQRGEDTRVLLDHIERRRDFFRNPDHAAAIRGALCTEEAQGAIDALARCFARGVSQGRGLRRARMGDLPRVADWHFSQTSTALDIAELMAQPVVPTSYDDRFNPWIRKQQHAQARAQLASAIRGAFDRSGCSSPPPPPSQSAEGGTVPVPQLAVGIPLGASVSEVPRTMLSGPATAMSIFVGAIVTPVVGAMPMLTPVVRTVPVR